MLSPCPQTSADFSPSGGAAKAAPRAAITKVESYAEWHGARCAAPASWRRRWCGSLGASSVETRPSKLMMKTKSLRRAGRSLMKIPPSSRRGVASCEDCLGDFLVNFKCDHLHPCVCSSHSVVLSRMHSSYVLVSETCARSLRLYPSLSHLPLPLAYLTQRAPL